ncbi:uncharacterized protein MONOS_14809 [Monocercomonoides exilis]|uniref:uncharacterized protein n=1 Tax=Monocercomonoides exilis TaxID=2049356 RepID=UPI003559A5F2|nr:hypothetical protein MONOS_14809 [Monocercomonoides exilis]|eukprot:MONOS_14809.1-p1 / transcript=MONOS_14809.1 / gene=MONOS_14809 / organism=Monocercomonoides_exilis_PA203 / gene_product=unspecified product / transcript_product=unspecified product / location=Mono_scaffold01077:14836-15300(-) / protein_length=155 / sequence_SO=supercontig / SO=protein_coding / is_pseudo=false
MEEDIEADQKSGIGSSFHSSSCSDYRCSGTSMGCDIQNQQQSFGLACQFSQKCPQPVVQLQGTTSCFASSAPFCSNNSVQQSIPSVSPIRQQFGGFQCESLERVEGFSTSSTQDMEMDRGEESDNKSTTSSRKNEPQSGCAVSIGKGSPLRNKG